MEMGCPSSPGSLRFIAFSGYRSLIAEEGGWMDNDMWPLLTGAKTTEQRWHSWIMFLVDMINLQRAGCLHDKIYAVFGIALKLQPASLRHAHYLGVNY
jgi:hypothetical protein